MIGTCGEGCKGVRGLLILVSCWDMLDWAGLTPQGGGPIVCLYPPLTLLGSNASRGGMVVWRMVNHYPHRVKAVISLCTPYTPASTKYIPLDQVIQTIPSFKYQVGRKRERERERRERVRTKTTDGIRMSRPFLPRTKRSRSLIRM